MISTGRYITCFIVFIFSFLIGKGQDYEVLIKAMSASRETRQFGQTIDYLQKIIAIDTIPDRRYFWYWQISGMYDSLGNKEQARSYCRLAVTDGNFDHSYSKRRYATRLADAFIDEKRYDSALYYLNHAATTPSIKNLRGSGMYMQTQFHYRVMLAYEGLNKIDSAINCYLPYAFDEWTNNEGTEVSTKHLSPKDYHCQVSDFLRILGKKYAQCEIEKQVSALPLNVYTVSSKEKHADGLLMYLEVKTRFFDHEIILDSFGTAFSSDTQEKEDLNFLKQQSLYRITHSLIYLFNAYSLGI
jgi:tetratricopeptide (TPR) repeat protein